MERPLYVPAESYNHELIHELKHFRWDILGFAEVKWTGI